jgi:surface protein
MSWFHRLFKYFFLLISLFFLTACGGYDLSGEGDPDLTPPVITILGDNPQVVEKGVVCHDSGAAAMDERDGYVNVVVSGTVDLSTAGIYTITYTATDSTGNTTTATRTVHVVHTDKTPPVLILNGLDEISVEVGEAYSEQNATAADDTDGDLTASIKIWSKNKVETNQIGEYKVFYTVTDSAGNRTEKSRVIKVVDSPTAFQITIETNQTGDSTDTHFIVPTNDEYEYDYKISCGNNKPKINYLKKHATGDYTCNYDEPGRYTIYIKGKFPAIYHNGRVEANETLSVDQWGKIEWKSMDGAFQGCENLKITATDSPDLSSVTSMHTMFHNASSMNSNSIKKWDVSNVTNMQGVFAGASNFNQPLNSWNVSSVTNMSWMFSNAQKFNQSLNDWDVSSVTNMGHMFKEAFSFNGEIGNWEVFNVTDMQQMFYESFAFNQSIEDWDVSNVTNMNGMFGNAYSSNKPSFNQPIKKWDVSNVSDMRGMFENASTFNQNISTWTPRPDVNKTSIFSNSKLEIKNRF